MSGRPMSFKAWRELREELVTSIAGDLDYFPVLDKATVEEKRNAAEKARDAVLKSLYEADAIEPPKGIDPS